MYVCIFMYINFKAICNVLHAKNVLKTHLFIKTFRLLYRSFVSLIYIIFIFTYIYIYIYIHICIYIYAV